MQEIDKGELRIFSELAIEATDSVPMSQWPVDELNELCARVTPIGSHVLLYANRSYLLSGPNPEAPVLTSSVGDLSYLGYFQGFQPFGYTQTLEPGSDIDMTIEEPTIRIDTLAEEVRLIPISAIVDMESEHYDAVALLAGDDLLDDVWVAMAGDSIDISTVESIFQELDSSDLRIQILVDYINDLLPVSSSFVGVAANRALFLNSDSFELVDFEEDILADIYEQSTFTVMGLENTDGTEVSQLFVSVLINGAVAYVPIHGITTLIDK
jgi:hypothetical protein